MNHFKSQLCLCHFSPEILPNPSIINGIKKPTASPEIRCSLWPTLGSSILWCTFFNQTGLFIFLKCSPVLLFLICHPWLSFTGNGVDPHATCLCALQWCLSKLSACLWPLCSLTFQRSVFIILLDYYLLFLFVCSLLIEPWMVEKNLWVIKHSSHNNLCP